MSETTQTQILKFPKRKRTSGTTLVPNAVLENQALFTHAELALILVLFRRNKGEATPISDRNWMSWTGLKARAKEYAVTGLKDKGLRIDGHGDTRLYSFDSKDFGSFLQTAKPPEFEKPRTKGRAVTAPPGTKIHEDCQQKGCLRLCEECDITPADRNLLMQPVAQNAAVAVNGFMQPVAQNPAADGTRKTAHGTSQRRSNSMQPVAQNRFAYPLTLDAIACMFATCDTEFVRLLVERVRARIDRVPTDDELVLAVRAARKKGQESEGLFLSTVPAVMRRIIAQGPTGASTKRSHPDFKGVVGELKKLKAKDPRFAEAVDVAIESIDTIPVGLSPAQLSDRCDRIAAPLQRLVRAFAPEHPQFANWRNSVERAADSMQLTGASRSDHIDTHLLIHGQDELGVPSIWPTF